MEDFSGENECREEMRFSSSVLFNFFCDDTDSAHCLSG